MISYYTQSFHDYFWQWEEGSSLLAIPDGNTIAYRAYMADVLEYLAENGLPPFGSILLAVVATNPNSPDSLSDIISKVTSIYIKSVNLNIENQNFINRAFGFLRILNGLPQEYKEGKKRLQLFQTIFSDCHNRLSKKDSYQILDAFKQGIGSTDNVQSISMFQAEKDLKPLQLLFYKFESAGDIINRIADIPEIPGIEDLEELPAKDLIQELTDNDKTFHVGSLVKSLWSGLNIPLHAKVPSQQPLGGVSDISNKGDFDKLLVTEFANDNLVFMSRLANNEALYINREIPPQSNNQQRIVLMDVSLRSWGTPKTIAHAVLVSLAKHPKTKVQYTAYAVGNSYYPALYNTVDAVIDGLNHVDGCLNSFNGLSAFFKEKYNDNYEVIFITTHDGVKYPEMQLLLGENRSKINYIIYAESNGKIDIVKQLRNSKKQIQAISLPLDDLWKKTKKQQQQTDSSSFIPLPEADDCPLFYEVHYSSSKNIITLDDEDYFIGKKNVLKRVAKDKGWKMIYKDLPAKQSVICIGRNEQYELLMLIASQNIKTITLINIHTGEKIEKFFAKSHWLKDNTYFIDDAFYMKGQAKKDYKINLDLTIEEIDFEVMQDKINTLEKPKFYPFANTIKNLKTFQITESNGIVINGVHVIAISGSTVRLVTHFSLKEKIKETATWVNKNTMRLKNGTQITVFESMLKIVTKNEEIYMPLVTDRNLAIAVKNNDPHSLSYMGNPYFYEAYTSEEDNEYIATALNAISNE